MNYLLGSSQTHAPLDAFGARSWTHPELTGYGRLPMATHLRRSDVLSLDGEWSFAIRARPEAVTDTDLAEAVPYAVAHKADKPASAAVYGGIEGGMTSEADDFIRAVMTDMLDKHQGLPREPAPDPMRL